MGDRPSAIGYGWWGRGDGRQGYQDLLVWQKLKDLAVLVYQISDEGKLSRDFGLKGQMRRSAVSEPSNIAEGDERETYPEAVRYFMAKGSLAELRAQLQITLEPAYIDPDSFQPLEEK